MGQRTTATTDSGQLERADKVERSPRIPQHADRWGLRRQQKGLDCLGEFLRGAFPHRRRVISSDPLPEPTVRAPFEADGPAWSWTELRG